MASDHKKREHVDEQDDALRGWTPLSEIENLKEIFANERENRETNPTGRLRPNVPEREND